MKKIVVIGGGPGGYVAAIRAAQLGADVTLIEKNKLGGTCLNVGCIPTKSLLHTAGLLSSARAAEAFGIKLDESAFNWAEVQKNKDAIVKRLVSGVSSLMKANGIKVVEGVGSLNSASCVYVAAADGSTRSLEADAIIIAAGSIPAVPPIPGLESLNACVDSTGALSFSELPKSLLVIGGGVIGLELATAYNVFGSRVTVVEAASKLLPMMDGELTDVLRAKMTADGIDIYTSAKVVNLEKSNEGAAATVETGGERRILQAEKVLVAVGRRADTAALGLQAAGIEHDHGRVKVDSRMRTSAPNVYAVGDCLGKVMLAHTAFAQGRVAAENAVGGASEYDEKTNPSCVYTEPEFAKVGQTEEELKAAGIQYVAGRFPLAANGKASIENGGVGMVKLLFGKKHSELLGAHILGPRATDIIGECALAIGLEATADEIVNTIHAHPTVCEAIQEAALAAEHRAIHMPNK